MRLPLALLVIAAGAAGLACNFNQEGVSPDSQKLFFPGAIAIDPDPDPRWLYVASSNADLRYNDGTLTAVDVKTAQTDLQRGLEHPDHTDPEAWPDCQAPTFTSRPPLVPDQDNVFNGHSCCWDLLDANVLNCDERPYINVNGNQSVKIGSFASAMVVQPGPPGRSTERRLLITVRGNTSVTNVDVDIHGNGPDDLTTTCAPDDPVAREMKKYFPECDANHRVSEVGSTDKESVQVFLPEEPYAMAIDVNPASQLNVLYVGHLRGGFISFFDLKPFNLDAVSPDARKPPDLLGVVNPGLFPGDINGSQGVTALTLTGGHRVYASSRFVPRVTSFLPVSADRDTPVDQLPDLGDNNLVIANAGDTFITSLVGAETRGFQFVDSVDGAGSRAFVLQRTPPALVSFERADGLNTPTAIIEVCSSPTFLDKHTLPGGAIRLYVTCFESGEVYVVDPYSARVEAIIEAGRGPSGLAFTPSTSTLHYAYVVGFGANNVSVIDLDPASPTVNHVVQRIGFPSAVPF